MNDDLEKVFLFSDLQEVSISDGEKKVRRRYNLSSAFKIQLSVSELIGAMYNLFKYEGSLDDYPVDEGFLYLNLSPEDNGMPLISLKFNQKTIKNDIFFQNFIDIVGSLGLHITLGVIWTHTSKQKLRKTSKSWRDTVLKDNVCACCGGDKHLQAHHIYGYSKYEMLRDDPNNGIALCRWCHKKYHSYFPGPANPKDLIEFFKRFGGNNE